ncbi:uncharacterized protein LOC133863148 [Alnus glutinosa]|uniref:uncharacterized protein LOC133863148 n=1 Tax=Alnus glutinosa TaxID=3517 RepID=UPI002D79CB23|nr:uncharacterized protein LOC133863148 [Alnus glutinosa]
MVFATMLVLVVAQVDDSCSKTPASAPSTLSLPQDTTDCDRLCDLRCSFKRGVPQLYMLCMQLCMPSCGGGQVLEQTDDSSSTTPAPAPSTISLPQDTSDCDRLCDLRCFLKRGIPQLYMLCMQLCKSSCGGGQDDPPSTTPAPAPPTVSLPQDTTDCDRLCDLRCSLKRGIPQLYMLCMQLCKPSCEGGQVLEQADDSSSTTPVPAPSTIFLPQDTNDCDRLCDLRCSLKRGIPQLYMLCMQLCKLSCGSGQVLEHADDSSSTLSLPQDEHAGDCNKFCVDKCYLEKHVPKNYNMCLDLCKKYFLQPLSYDIYHCTSACAASMSTKLGSGAEKDNGDYVEICYNNCKKNV